MNKQRELFEVWAKAELMNTTKYGVTGVYCYPDAHRAWTAWQAAIASVVVELPENGPPVFLNDYAEGVVAGANIYKSAIEAELDRVGIKWK